MPPHAPLPRAILFDMDDTILDDSGAIEACWRTACCLGETHEARVAAEELYTSIRRYADWYWGDPLRHRAGRLDMRAARRDIVAGALRGLDVDAPQLAAAIADAYGAAREEAVAPLPGAIETLRRLCELDVRLALLTNGNAAMQRRKIEAHGLAAYFACVLIEGEFGAGKPDERVYHHALERLEVAAGDAWMVGDNLEWEVAAPQRLGIYSVWVDVRGAGLPADSAVRPDRIIRAVRELIAPLPEES
jgi:putative hydrolase of the HAD superfamily